MVLGGLAYGGSKKTVTFTEAAGNTSGTLTIGNGSKTIGVPHCTPNHRSAAIGEYPRRRGIGIARSAAGYGQNSCRIERASASPDA